ncbi:sulfurtransferase [Agrobacterium sp. Ap1]|jgi:thiosulfate/3-mercaptopyruvate sulfurtransferase|uniref:sulfurtransferase n=1 Tax=Agrobacterium sp. Ap1 TaxID=2815337 RepID=UPI001A8CC63C|nr:sulfurtransferase [Agrobacterium sp. Ap1]MBO0143494.1 sulfurtransferase [Agrobacterium sp. Ap1]
MSAIKTAISTALIAFMASTAAYASDALVDAEWVQKNLDNPKVRIFEVSVDTGAYERGHIPGAANLNWHTDLVDRERRDIASREAFEKHLQAAGVGEDTTIVLYGDNNNWFAAWGAWVFETYGLGDRVKLLDGGRKLWEAKGLPLDSKATERVATNLKIKDRDPSVRARFTDVVAVAEGKHDIKLIDIRSADEYSGKIFAPEGVKELSVRAGHIPGAVNVPWGSIVNADGTFKTADEIKSLYAAKGVDGSKPIITYCRIGERSSHTWFALKKILGYDVRNYDGSWTEYGNAVGVPVSNPSGTIWTGK